MNIRRLDVRIEETPQLTGKAHGVDLHNLEGEQGNELAILLIGHPRLISRLKGA